MNTQCVTLIEGVDFQKREWVVNALIVIGNTVQFVSNCIECPHHKIVSDPDKDDSFCSDDVAVLCSVTPNSDSNPSKAWKSWEIWPYRAITTSCRPYKTREECELPEWCPSLYSK